MLLAGLQVMSGTAVLFGSRSGRNLWLRYGRAQNVFVGAAACAAACEFAVNDDSGDASNAVTFSFGHGLGLVHFVSFQRRMFHMQRNDRTRQKDRRFVASGIPATDLKHMVLSYPKHGSDVPYML